MAMKWNFKTRKYEPYELPKGATLYESDMDAEVSCAQCGRSLTFGKGYTSRQIHNNGGMGFCVCGNCYAEEWEEEKKTSTVAPDEVH